MSLLLQQHTVCVPTASLYALEQLEPNSECSGEGKYARFIVESEFLFSQNRSFLLVVFGKWPFSQELCQKMALLYAEHSSPLQQVIKRSGKTAASKSIRLSQADRKRICLHIARQGRFH